MADVVEAEEEDRTPHVEPTRQADAGEHVDSIVRQMEIDDLMALTEEEALEEDDDDSFDEDEGPIPQE